MPQTNPQGFFGGISSGLVGGPNQNQDPSQINQSQVSPWLAQGQGDQSQAMGMAQQTAAGQGPSAAQGLLNAQTQQTMNANNALASSGAGANGAGAARRQAMMQNSSALQGLGANAATARAQEQLGGEALYGQEAGQARGQNLQAGQINAGMAENQAQLMTQQNIANQQAAAQNSGNAMNMMGSLAGAAGGIGLLAMSDANAKTDIKAADADLQEPGAGDSSHITLREQPWGLMLLNHATGELSKVATQPLSPAEHADARGPHGAGPIDSPNRQRTEFSDMKLGGSQDPWQKPNGLGWENTGPETGPRDVSGQGTNSDRWSPWSADTSNVPGQDPVVYGSQGNTEQDWSQANSLAAHAAEPGAYNDAVTQQGQPGGLANAGVQSRIPKWNEPGSASSALSNDEYQNSGWDQPIRDRGGAAPGDEENYWTGEEEKGAQAAGTSGKPSDMNKWSRAGVGMLSGAFGHAQTPHITGSIRGNDIDLRGRHYPGAEVSGGSDSIWSDEDKKFDIRGADVDMASPDAGHVRKSPSMVGHNYAAPTEGLSTYDDADVDAQDKPIYHDPSSKEWYHAPIGESPAWAGQGERRSRNSAGAGTYADAGQKTGPLEGGGLGEPALEGLSMRLGGSTRPRSLREASMSRPASAPAADMPGMRQRNVEDESEPPPPQPVGQPSAYPKPAPQPKPMARPAQPAPMAPPAPMAQPMQQTLPMLHQDARQVQAQSNQLAKQQLDAAVTQAAAQKGAQQAIAQSVQKAPDAAAAAALPPQVDMNGGLGSKEKVVSDQNLKKNVVSFGESTGRTKHPINNTGAGGMNPSGADIDMKGQPRDDAAYGTPLEHPKPQTIRGDAGPPEPHYGTGHTVDRHPSNKFGPTQIAASDMDVSSFGNAGHTKTADNTQRGSGVVNEPDSAVSHPNYMNDKGWDRPDAAGMYNGLPPGLSGAQYVPPGEKDIGTNRVFFPGRQPGEKPLPTSADLDLKKRGTNGNGDSLNPQHIPYQGSSPGTATIVSDKMKKEDIKKLGENVNRGGGKDTEAGRDKSTSDTGDKGGAEQKEAKRSDSTSGRKDGDTQHKSGPLSDAHYAENPAKSKEKDYYGAKNPSVGGNRYGGAQWYDQFVGDPPVTQGHDPWGRVGAEDGRIHAADMDMFGGVNDWLTNGMSRRAGGAAGSVGRDSELAARDLGGNFGSGSYDAGAAARNLLKHSDGMNPSGADIDMDMGNNWVGHGADVDLGMGEGWWANKFPPGRQMNARAWPEQFSDPRYEQRLMDDRGVLERDDEGSPMVITEGQRPGHENPWEARMRSDFGHEPVFAPDREGMMRPERPSPSSLRQQADEGMRGLDSIRKQQVGGLQAGPGLAAARMEPQSKAMSYLERRRMGR